MADEADRVAMVSDLAALAKSLERRITEEGETTRRHFDIMVEKLQDALYNLRLP